MVLLKHITIKIYQYLTFFLNLPYSDALKRSDFALLIGRKIDLDIFFRIYDRKIFYINMWYYRLLPANKSSQVLSARERNKD